VDVRNAARATIEALTAGESGRKWLLTGKNMTFRDFFTTVGRLQGKKKLIIPIPLWLMKNTALIFDLAEKVFHRDLPFNSTQQRLLCLDNYFSNRKAQDEIAMKETNVDEAVISALSWFHENGHSLR
jgi:dihydroflavonol-4-reductase